MQLLFMFILIGGFLGTKDPSKFDSKFLIKCIYQSIYFFTSGKQSFYPPE